MPSISEIDRALDAEGIFSAVVVPASLVEEFQAYEAERKRKLMELALLTGLGFYLGFPLIDWLIVPDVIWSNLAMRLLLALPVGVLVLRILRSRGRHPEEHQAAAGSLAILYAALFSGVIALSSAPAAPIYLTANNAIMIFAVTMMGLPFILAAACAVAIVAFQAAAVAVSSFAATGVLLAVATTGLAVATPALYANWALQNERRRHFLSMKREEIHRRTIADQRDMLERLAAIDPLTGLANRRGFDAALSSDLTKAGPETMIAVAMVDIDHFKAYNDLYGHPAGDVALRRVARALASSAGAGTRVARLGGEEFALAIAHVQPIELDLFGARLLKAVRDLLIPHRAGSVNSIITVSIGISVGPAEGDDADALFEIADRALYKAKTDGRDRTVIMNKPFDLAATSHSA